MRNITTVTNQILTVLAGASIAPRDADNNITMQAELRVLLRRAAYAPPESVEQLWIQLGTTLYRYMPPLQPTGYTAEIAAIATGK